MYCSHVKLIKWIINYCCIDERYYSSIYHHTTFFGGALSLKLLILIGKYFGWWEWVPRPHFITHGIDTFQIFLFLIRLFNKEFLLLCFCSYSSCNIAFLDDSCCLFCQEAFNESSCLRRRRYKLWIFCSHGKQAFKWFLSHSFIALFRSALAISIERDHEKIFSHKAMDMTLQARLYFEKGSERNLWFFMVSSD